MSYNPIYYGDKPDPESEITTKAIIEYGFKLTSDDDGQKSITLPEFLGSTNQFYYEKNPQGPDKVSKDTISFERLAVFKPISRPYGETILYDEAASSITSNNIVYASKHLPRADELTACIDLNTRDLSNFGKYDHNEYFPIRMGNMLETPTPSWTPTISWTPTNTYTPTETITDTHTVTPSITESPMPTPTPSPTQSPDLDKVGTIFRDLWLDETTDYFSFAHTGTHFGIRFKYRKFILDNYIEHENMFGSKHLTGGDRIPIFNPIRKIELLINNVKVDSDKFNSDGTIKEVFYNHEPIDIEKTFDAEDNVFNDKERWYAMKRTNEATFAPGNDEPLKVIEESTQSGGRVQKGFEIFVPFEYWYDLDEAQSDSVRPNRWEKFNELRDSALLGFNEYSRYDCCYFMFEAQHLDTEKGFDVQSIRIYASKEEEYWDTDTGAWELKDNPDYVKDEIDEIHIYEHGETIGDSTFYMYSVPTPTPSPTITTTETITNTVSCTPTPTFTVSPTETISATPSPTVTITEPTPTPTITKTLQLFNIDETKGVNMIGSFNVIRRDGTTTLASNLFNIGPMGPIGPMFDYFTYDGNVDI